MNNPSNNTCVQDSLFYFILSWSHLVVFMSPFSMQSINSICESMFNSINVLLADIYNGLSFGGVADKSFCKTLVEAQWQIVNDFRYSLVF